MRLQTFIQKRPYLLWYVKDLSTISEEAIVEAVLNYGDMDDVNEIINILGMQKVAAIFHSQIQRKRHNYDPKIKHYFELFFKKYAPA